MIILSLLFSCKRKSENVSPNELFYGTVLRQNTACNGSTGFPYIIKYRSSNNTDDSLSTLTLPVPLSFSGTRIEFQMRNPEKEDALIFCNAMGAYPMQKVIFNVKPQ